MTVADSRHLPLFRKAQANQPSPQIKGFAADITAAKTTIRRIHHQSEDLQHNPLPKTATS
jgi:hypothetical protein